ncbi:MAG: Flp family type IVb pilin [Actinomycetota bacterium]
MTRLITTISQTLTRLRRTEVGASMVEYALLVALIAMIAFAALAFAGDELSTTYSDIAVSVQDAGS